MKVWKRGLALVSALGFVGAGVACQTETEKKLENMTPQTQVEDVATSLEGVKSLKMSMDTSATVKGVADGEKGDMAMNVGVDLWLSKTDDFLDAKLVVEVSTDMKVDGEEETQEEALELYLVDGYVYMVAEVEGEKMGVKTEDSIFAILADEMNMKKSEVKAMFADAFEKAEEVGVPADLLKEFLELSPVDPSEEKTETSMTLVYDYKTMIDNLIGNVTGITDKTTIGNFINSMLKDLNSDMTCNKILDKIEPYGQKTLAELKTELEEEFDVTAEEWLSALKANTDLLAMLDEMQPGMSDMIKELEIEELMDEIGDMKIDDIIKEMSGEDLTVEDMVAQTKELLKTPVKEVMPVEEELLEVLEAITINTAETEFTTTYDEDANLLSISVGSSTNVKIKKDKENDLTITSDVSYELSEFSKSATEIQLPDIEWGKY